MYPQPMRNWDIMQTTLVLCDPGGHPLQSHTRHSNGFQFHHALQPFATLLVDEDRGYVNVVPSRLHVIPSEALVDALGTISPTIELLVTNAVVDDHCCQCSGILLVQLKSFLVTTKSQRNSPVNSLLYRQVGPHLPDPPKQSYLSHVGHSKSGYVSWSVHPPKYGKRANQHLPRAVIWYSVHEFAVEVIMGWSMMRIPYLDQGASLE